MVTWLFGGRERRMKKFYDLWAWFFVEEGGFFAENLLITWNPTPLKS